MFIELSKFITILNYFMATQYSQIKSNLEVLIDYKIL